MTPEEIKEARANAATIRRMPSVDGKSVAIVIDKAIDAIIAEGERADRAEARALAASSIITDLQLHMDPNAIGDSATEAFERAMEWLTEAPV